MSSINRSGGRTDHAGPEEYALFGVVLYMGWAVAMFVHKLLEYSLADDDSVIYFARDDDVLFHAADSVTGLIDGGSGLLLAVLIGLLYYYVIASDDPPVTAAAIASVAGSVATIILFMLLLLIFEPDGTDVSLGAELPGLIATIVAPAVAAAVTVLALDATDS